MNQYYIINTLQIQYYISELDKLYPDRVLCGLDLLLENIQNNLLHVMQDDKIMVEIDSQKKEVTLLGEELPTENWKIIFDAEKNSESIYNTFIFAMDYVVQIDGGEDMIREIRTDK